MSRRSIFLATATTLCVAMASTAAIDPASANGGSFGGFHTGLGGGAGFNHISSGPAFTTIAKQTANIGPKAGAALQLQTPSKGLPGKGVGSAAGLQQVGPNKGLPGKGVSLGAGLQQTVPNSGLLGKGVSLGAGLQQTVPNNGSPGKGISLGAGLQPNKNVPNTGVGLGTGLQQPVQNKPVNPPPPPPNPPAPTPPTINPPAASPPAPAKLTKVFGSFPRPVVFAPACDHVDGDGCHGNGTLDDGCYWVTQIFITPAGKVIRHVKPCEPVFTNEP
jgi:hypothetical protein